MITTLSVASFIIGCTTSAPRIEYLPESGRVEKLQAGQAAPFEGYLVPPGLMAEMGPCLKQAYERRKGIVLP